MNAEEFAKVMNPTQFDILCDSMAGTNSLGHSWICDVAKDFGWEDASYNDILLALQIYDEHSAPFECDGCGGVHSIDEMGGIYNEEVLEELGDVSMCSDCASDYNEE